MLEVKHGAHYKLAKIGDIIIQLFFEWSGLRATSHTSQGSWPWNGECPWLSSKGHNMGVGKAILCSDGPSNIVWSGNRPYWGTIACFIRGKKKDNPTSLVTYVHFYYYYFTFFFNFTLVGKERRAWWIILREEEGFLLNWLYIGVHTWSCNMCLICKHELSMENGKMPWFWALALRVWRWAIIVSGHLREMYGSLISYY